MKYIYTVALAGLFSISPLHANRDQAEIKCDGLFSAISQFDHCLKNNEWFCHSKFSNIYLYVCFGPDLTHIGGFKDLGASISKCTFELDGKYFSAIEFADSVLKEKEISQSLRDYLKASVDLAVDEIVAPHKKNVLNDLKKHEQEVLNELKSYEDEVRAKVEKEEL